MDMQAACRASSSRDGYAAIGVASKTTWSRTNRPRAMFVNESEKACYLFVESPGMGLKETEYKRFLGFLSNYFMLDRIAPSEKSYSSSC
jgi:hypothetical protein